MEAEAPSGINVPVELRSHEQFQLAEYVPKMEERLRERDLDEQADAVSDFTFTVDATDDVAGQYASAPAEDWEKVIQYLNILRPQEGLRVWWLRKKLAKRLARRLEEMEVEEDDD